MNSSAFSYNSRAETLCTLDALSEHLRFTRIAAGCHLPEDFDTGHTLGGRIRGALGRALARNLNPCWRGLPSAFELLFALPVVSPRPVCGKFFNPSRPYVLRLRTHGRVLTIEILLFGRAAIAGRAVRDGLAQALRNGVQVAVGRPASARLEPYNLAIDELPVAPPLLPTCVHTLHLVSPLALDRDGVRVLSAEALLNSMAARVSAVAAWNDISLPDFPDFRHVPDLIVDFIGTRYLHWSRRRHADGEREVPMGGFLGSIPISGPGLDVIRPVLRLLPFISLGMGTVFGNGEVAVSCEDDMFAAHDSLPRGQGYPLGDSLRLLAAGQPNS